MDAVLFDMDGVLVDSVTHKIDGWRRLLHDELGLDVPATELVGLNARDKYAYLRQRTDVGLDEATFVDRISEGVDEVYTEQADLLDCFEDVTAALGADDVRIGVVTAGTEEHLEQVVERFDIRHSIDATVSSDAIDGPSKPAPDLYLHAAETLGIDPTVSVAVEDSPNGTRAAKRAGMYCLGYHAPRSPEQDLGVADETATGPDELEAKLLALASDDRFR